MAGAYLESRSSASPKTLVGWQGIRFTLPPDWNVTGISTDIAGGYLKVDSPGSMFVQVKWSDLRQKKPASLYELVFSLIRRIRGIPPPDPRMPDLRKLLDNFLKMAQKQARKARTEFESKVKPETRESGGERVAHNFSWAGAGNGQGKIWYCGECGKVVIAQVVGQRRDNLAGVAAEMFGSMEDHGADGWTTWALYDMAAATPSDFAVKSQKLMSGYLRLELQRRGERVLLERWGLASVTLKKFTLADWFLHAAQRRAHERLEDRFTVQDHPTVHLQGRVAGVIARARAVAAAAASLRPALEYGGIAWVCEQSNRINSVQMWYNRRSAGLLEEIAARCRCH